MKNKGFTLAELIGVIVVLSLICLITVPAVANILKQNKQSLCKTQLNNILVAANNYASENLLSMPTVDQESKIITLQDLIDTSFIDEEIKNPVNKEVFDPEITIKIKKVGKKLEVDFLDDTTFDLCKEDENE